MKPRALFLSLCGIVLVTSSCSKAKWTERQIDGPWVAPGVHASEFGREYFAGIMDSGVTTDTVWTTANGKRKDASRIAALVQKRLKELGYFERWPESHSNMNGYQQRVAPFTFHIVAIEPTVVILVPHDFGYPKGNRSTYDIVGQPPKQSFQSRYMLNYIEYGTTLPYHADVLWFSPEIENPPSALARRNDSEQELAHGNIRLVLKREEGVWKTRRELP